MYTPNQGIKESLQYSWEDISGLHFNCIYCYCTYITVITVSHNLYIITVDINWFPIQGLPDLQSLISVFTEKSEYIGNDEKTLKGIKQNKKHV